MKTLALVSQKGGSGKSSLATSVAVAAAETGERVVILDIDPQGSAKAWAARRTGAAILVETPAHAALHKRMTALKAEGVTLVILDTPGVLSAAVSVAIQAATFILVPVRPSVVDVQAAISTVKQLRLLRSRFGLVVNSAHPNMQARTIDTAQALATLGPLAPVVVHQRADFLDAMMGGIGVTEILKGKAADEVHALWQWLATQMEVSK